MSEDTNTEATAESETNVDVERQELEVLKARARMIGLTFSNNIGLSALRAKVNAKLSEESTDDLEPPEEDPTLDSTEAANASAALASAAAPAAPVKKAKKLTLRQYLINEEMKLVRVRIANLDPKKKDLPGEIITVANEHLGTVRKYIPFGEATDEGYHIPMCLYRFLEARRFQNIRTIKDRRTGTTRVESNWQREFSLEVLPQLTEDELNRLAMAQTAAGSIT